VFDYIRDCPTSPLTHKIIKAIHKDRERKRKEEWKQKLKEHRLRKDLEELYKKKKYQMQDFPKRRNYGMLTLNKAKERIVDAIELVCTEVADSNVYRSLRTINL
jgi:hypothetical protein